MKKAELNPYIAFADVLLLLFVASVSLNLYPVEPSYVKPKRQFEAELLAFLKSNNDDIPIVVDKEVREEGVTRLVTTSSLLSEDQLRRLCVFLKQSQLELSGNQSKGLWRRLTIEAHVERDPAVSREPELDSSFQLSKPWIKSLSNARVDFSAVVVATRGSVSPRVKLLDPASADVREKWANELPDEDEVSYLSWMAKNVGLKNVLFTAGFRPIKFETGAQRMVDIEWGTIYPTKSSLQFNKLAYPCDSVKECLRLNTRVELVLAYDKVGQN
jgi:hypothetical protein